MIFCFSFFTYNVQRFIKFKSTNKDSSKLGKRLQWISKQKNLLTILSIIFGIIGIGCSFYVHFLSFAVLIPMGVLSFFYVVPILPFYKKSLTLREIPYFKIFIIGFVWSLIIIGLPTLNTSHFPYFNIDYPIALLQVFLFTIAITLPFDIRDIEYDKANNLKTIPQLLGVKNTIILSEFLLISSIILLYISDIKNHHFYGLLTGHIIAMIVISFTKKEREELFFAAIIEGLIIVLYLCVLISEYCFSL
ncbi:MAG: hypothetical protein COB15_08425 [Flavobacteriales bacterium]|nr:MAG: hypothetical protein COB15_08425 [Flavobacteriales bacterium]